MRLILHQRIIGHLYYIAICKNMADFLKNKYRLMICSGCLLSRALVLSNKSNCYVTVKLKRR